ncbi:YdbC family protein [Sporosarcina sp. BP05]|uniref:YdbC family protein n=1 Tax=Sporosarcina sp. BP05 TaxID=2758726 RepID=UPI001646C431|nr:PC4/YdbC family ssDNA-binding protein [Sporosarcina sp. BP05]
MAEFKYEIIETVAVLSEGNKGWQKELNLISWNGREPVFDIRDWTEDHKKMGKGMTFKISELKILKESLEKMVELD